MKLTFKLPLELQNAIIDLPKTVPVYTNFDHSQYIGEAKVNKDGTADIEVLDQLSKEMYDKISNQMNFRVSDIGKGKGYRL
jgi:hypothetical protein